MKKLMYIGVLSVFASAVAYAHTELSSSMPADEAVLETAPQQVMLHFSEPVRLTALSIQGPGREKQDLGPLPSEMSANFSVAAPDLAAGDYVVTWRSLSEDTHVMMGEFGFKVQPNASHAQHSQSH